MVEIALLFYLFVLFAAVASDEKAKASHENVHEVYDGDFYGPSEVQYNEVTIAMLNLVAQFPLRARLLNIGNTTRRRVIHAMKITWGVDNNIIFVEGGIHGGEWLGVRMALQLCYRLLVKDMPDHWQLFDWVVVPMSNPDAFVASVGNFVHRKNLNYERCNAAACRSRNLTCGVDLFSNYPAHWSTEDGWRPCDINHPGKKPASEVETRCMLRLLRDLGPFVRLYLGLHHFGGLLTYPYSTPHRGYTDERALAGLAAVAVEQMNRAAPAGTTAPYRAGNYAKEAGIAFGTPLDFYVDKVRTRYAYVLTLRPPPHQVTKTHAADVGETHIRRVLDEGFAGVAVMLREVASEYPPRKEVVDAIKALRKRRRKRGSTVTASANAAAVFVCCCLAVVVAGAIS